MSRNTSLTEKMDYMGTNKMQPLARSKYKKESCGEESNINYKFKIVFNDVSFLRGNGLADCQGIKITENGTSNAKLDDGEV